MLAVVTDDMAMVVARFLVMPTFRHIPAMTSTRLLVMSHAF